MAAGHLKASLIYLAALLAVSTCVQPTKEEHTLQTLLQDALVNGNTFGVPNLYVLEANFFPAQELSPICIPVNYLVLSCDSDGAPCIDSAHALNTSFLWTQYDFTLPIGALLLSYASSGIILKGFDWEDACIFSEPLQLNLALNTSKQFSMSTLTTALLGVTSQVAMGYILSILPCTNKRSCTMMKPHFKGKTTSTKLMYSRKLIHPSCIEKHSHSACGRESTPQCLVRG